MAEGVGCAVERGRLHHRHLVADPAQQGHEITVGGATAVQQHVVERELDLAQGLQTGLEVFGRQHFVEQLAGQGLTGVHVGGHVFEHVPFPAEVLHELARQFHRVPFDAADAGHIAFVDLGQHVVQAMTELVEEGDGVVVGEQRRLAIDALGEVAHQVGHRGLQAAVVWAQPAGAHVVHPGPAAFARAGARVEVELAHQLGAAGVACRARPFDAEKPHGGVPHRRLIGADADLKQGFNDLEQAVEHLGGREGGFDVLVAVGVARLAQLLADERPIPGLRVVQAQVVAGVGAHVGQVLLGVGAGFVGQVAQEGDHLVGRVGHFGRQGNAGKVGVAQQGGLFRPQCQQLADGRRVVVAHRVALGLVAGAGGVGPVQAFAQRPVGAVLHDGQVAGHFQAQLVALQTVGLGRRPCGRQHVGGHAVHF